MDVLPLSPSTSPDTRRAPVPSAMGLRAACSDPALLVRVPFVWSHAISSKMTPMIGSCASGMTQEHDVSMLISHQD